jgi:dihydroorotate dehydrogenase
MQPSLKVKVLSSQTMYRVIRRILFLFPPERMHYFSMNCLKVLCSVGIVRRVIHSIFDPPTPRLRRKGSSSSINADRISGHSTLQNEFFRLDFKNPIGLGAGFDKNALWLRELQALGFGFIEIGTVTPKPQPGNDKPRLFRLPKDKALINRMGFNNDGADAIAKRLKMWRDNSRLTSHDSRLIIGGNIGKNKDTPNDEAWKDYASCFNTLHAYVDYFVVNVSSPNTPGLRELQEKESLRKILMHLQMINNGKARSKPILLKISPDITREQLDDIIDLALEIKLDGLVATNTTTNRDYLKTPESKLMEIGEGGLSGQPLKEKSNPIIRHIHAKTKGSIPIIASGGIFTGDDALEKFTAGASLIQVWTGFIYEGPAIAKKIAKTLLLSGS